MSPTSSRWWIEYLFYDGICANTKFWDHDTCWATPTPTLTSCFIDTALVWPQQFFLWLMLPYYLYSYRFEINDDLNQSKSTKNFKRKFNNWNFLVKLLILITLALIQFVHAIHMTVISYQYTRPDYLSPAHLIGLWLKVASYLLIIVYLNLQNRKQNLNCGVVWFYLFISLIVNLIILVVSHSHRPIENWLYLPVEFVLEFSLFISCSFSNVEYVAANDRKKEFIKHHPRDSASIPSRFSFWWFNSLVLLGYRRPLTAADLWPIRKHDSSQFLLQKFENHCKGPSPENSDQIKNKSEVHYGHHNLWKILSKMFWLYFLFPAMGRVATDLLQLANPIVLKLMIDYTVSSDVEIWHGILYSLAFFVINMIQSCSASYQQHRFSVLALRIRSTLIGAIYRKSLRLANHERLRFTTGDIINFMAVDSQRCVDLVRFIHNLWTAPLLITLGFYLLWEEMGPSVVGGLVLMFLMLPAQSYMAKKIKTIQRKQMDLKDERLNSINELLNGMKILKLYAWERAFIKKIERIRMAELFKIKMAGLITAVYVTLAVCSPFLITFTVFTVYTQAYGHVLTSEKAFVTIALFNLLRMPLTTMANMLTSLILTVVSIKRINKFLDAEEIENYVQRKPMPVDAIHISNASFSWDPINSKRNALPTLSNLNLRVPKGKLIAVVGQVGSGKSSLLSALLGEMHKHGQHGSMIISEGLKIAYVAQQAWIQNLTARDNILFGHRYDPSKYDRVIQACALKADFDMLDGGDQTEIGEKGINLSGGQKQRISVARACYSDSDLYLFDDPLSAGKHIFEQVLDSSQGILRKKTRILVTNALYVLPMVDEIIVLKNGAIDAIGTYQELLAKNTSFAELINSYNQTQQQSPEENLLEPKKESSKRQPLQRQMTISSITTEISFEDVDASNVTSESCAAMVGRLVEKESMETGKITWTVYGNFFRSITPSWIILIVVSYSMNAIASSGANFWLSSWTNKMDDLPPEQNTNNGLVELLIFFMIGVTQIIFISSGWTSLLLGCLRSSQVLHEKLIDSIVHAPMYFFDTTPLGRIMNRFSRDIDSLDNTMALLMRVYLLHMSTILVTLFIISYQTPLFLVFAIPIIVVYFFIQRFYVSTSRQVKRIESVSRSPIFTHFSETINGVPTIRAYEAQQRFIKESDGRVDQNFRCFYPIQVADCWLALRVEFLANLMIFFASFLSVLMKLINQDGEGLSGSQIGLSLSYALNITLSLNHCVRVSAEFENNVVSVERINEYIDIEPEASWFDENDHKLPSNWPIKGSIDLVHYATRYRPGLDLVLKDVDIRIREGEKVGIVGRTGAGKSSLTLALFRLIEAAEGRIIIDGVDISGLGLHKLRSRLTIIPQDPVLFCGSLRFNLDPFNEYDDQQIWSALELSHLKKFVQSLDTSLEFQVSESGENFSVGQRQLFCLARALLRRTNVLILDEATAAVDFETDALIQTTIRQEFKNCTILTIAHRLNTIMDSNRVLVLDAGRVAEFDAPESLLSNQQTIFFSLAKDAGIVNP